VTEKASKGKASHGAKASAPKATAAEAQATQEVATPPQGAVPVNALPRFNPYAPPLVSEQEAQSAQEYLPRDPTQSYEAIQAEARGPGVEEWRQADKARAELSEYYRDLADDERYSPEYKSQAAWEKYEETRARIASLAPEARKQMLNSAESLERMSIPHPDGEALSTSDTDKLLLTAHERTRIEGVIKRYQEMGERGPFPPKSAQDVVKEAYEAGLAEGGPAGGATVRAAVGLARDHGLDIDSIVDEHRKASHRGALNDAYAARRRADLISRVVPQPPFKQASRGANRAGAVMTTSSGRPIFKRRRPSWK
jgi:hypothetical protein